MGAGWRWQRQLLAPSQHSAQPRHIRAASAQHPGGRRSLPAWAQAALPRRVFGACMVLCRMSASHNSGSINEPCMELMHKCMQHAVEEQTFTLQGPLPMSSCCLHAALCACGSAAQRSG